ncbi:MAG: nuclear transport factor 2 family protein [Bacteroidales bacterium]|nr:nuclear transport factor 2 family protein [Bacteroidales bacterium]
MKKNLIFFAVCSSILFLSSCQPTCNIEEETEKVELVLERYIIANETKDIDLVHQVWAPDKDIVVFGTESNEKLIGWEAIKRVVERQFDNFEDVYISASDQVIKVNCHGNAAWFSEILDYNYTFNEKAYAFEGIRFTGVMEKQGEDWLIVQSHLSVPFVPR